MDESRGKAILDLAAGRILEDEFALRFGSHPREDYKVIEDVFERAVAAKSADDIEYAIILAYKFGLSPKLAPMLSLLLEEDWHYKHEDIASALQDIHLPSTVDSLYRAALHRPTYLEDLDSHALARKCIWALHDIGTAQAVEKLTLLLDADAEQIRHWARERLDDLAARRPGDPIPAYRLNRDKHIRSS